MPNNIKKYPVSRLVKLDTRRRSPGQPVLRSRESSVPSPRRPLAPLSALTETQQNDLKIIQKMCNPERDITSCDATEAYAIGQMFPRNKWDSQTKKLVLTIIQKATDDTNNPYLQKLSDNILEYPTEWDTLSRQQLQRKTLHCLKNPSFY